MIPGNPEPVFVAVFAKAPVPGRVKTRLIPRLGAEVAANLQGAMLRRAVKTALDAGLGPVSVWCTPDCEHPVFAELRRDARLELFEQQGEDLGARMLQCFSMLCKRGPTILIGTDCPALDAKALALAAGALGKGLDAVFLPADDGGYVLIGLRVPEPGLFSGVAWGTSLVMEQTRQRLAALDWQWAEPLSLWDVDRPEDVDRMRNGGFLEEEWLVENRA